MDRPRRESRQHNGITVRGLSQLTFATKSALFGHATISELSLLSGVKRKLDFEPAKGSFWRKAVVACQKRNLTNQTSNDLGTLNVD